MWQINCNTIIECDGWVNQLHADIKASERGDCQDRPHVQPSSVCKSVLYGTRPLCSMRLQQTIALPLFANGRI